MSVKHKLRDISVDSSRPIKKLKRESDNIESIQTEDDFFKQLKHTAFLRY